MGRQSIGLLLAASLISRAVARPLQRVPINFWVLTSGSAGSLPNELDVSLCRSCFESHQAGDAAALEHDLDALSKRPVAVELATSSSGRRVFQLPGPITCSVDEISFGEGGLGHSVWDAGVALSIRLAHQRGLVGGHRVLELGSGVGVAGIAAALSGASSVTLSDVAEESSGLRRGARTRLLQNLRSNAELNGLGSRASVENLDWEECASTAYEPVERYSRVVGSDLVYYEHVAPALAAAVTTLTAPGGVAHLMSVKGRPGGERLVDLLRGAEGEVATEEVGLVNNFGRTELLLTTFRAPGRQE